MTGIDEDERRKDSNTMSDQETNGPVGGSTPANDADLHTGSNPYAQGSPPTDLAASSDYRPGSPAGYYTNPPTAGNGNPYSDGAAGQASDANDYMSGGF